MKDIILWTYIVLHLLAIILFFWRSSIKPALINIFNFLSDISLAEEKPALSLRQAAFLGITLVISTADVFLPKFIAMDAGKDAWLSVILSGIEIGVLLGVILYFLKRFPNKNFTSIVKESFSPFFSIPLLSLWLLYLLVKASITARELGEVVYNGFLTDTPIEAIILGILLITGYAAKKGLQPIARSNDFLLSAGVATLFFVIFMLLSEAEFKNFLPILENGIKPVIKGSLPSVPWLSDIVLILCLVYPYIDNPKKVSRYFALSLVFLLTALELGTLAIAIFGIGITENLIFPALEMVRVLKITDFLERFEVPLITVWISGIFVKLAFVYYAVVDTIKTWWRLKNRKSAILPIGFILFWLAIYPYPSITSLLFNMHKIYPYSTLAVYILVVSVLVVATFKNKISADIKNKTVYKSLN